MGEILDPAPALLIIGMSSRHDGAFEWARARATAQFGPIALESSAFDFTETDYYAATMGANLRKQFLAFERLIDPAELADIKRRTNEWEKQCAASGSHAEPRPLNLDPGYITPAKLTLASTKDHAHRIYLRSGVYAELTLSYRGRHWQPLEWTYPDYSREDYRRFFTECRTWLLNCGAGGGGLK